MITIVTAPPGGGKTLSVVRDMYFKQDETFYSNIVTHGMKNNILLTKDMIYKETILGVKKNGEVIKTYEPNLEYWKNVLKNKRINIVIDEAHQIVGVTRTKKSKVVLDWMALIRKILGTKDFDYGNLVLISQLERRIDVVPKEMGTRFKFCKMWYVRRCCECGYAVEESNETPEPMFKCFNCMSSKTKKESFRIEMWSFMNFDAFIFWRYRGQKTYYDRVIIDDTELYFNKYDSYQWENLIS